MEVIAGILRAGEGPFILVAALVCLLGERVVVSDISLAEDEADFRCSSIHPAPFVVIFQKGVEEGFLERDFLRRSRRAGRGGR